MLVYHTKNSEETHDIAVNFGKQLKPGDLLAYRGGLGAGKTTFTRGIVQGMGIDAHVSSPTFALINEYTGQLVSVYHFDMYRIFDFDSLNSTGFFDYLDSKKGIIAIEWSENIQDELPDNTIFITIEMGSDLEFRKITIEGDRF